MAPMATSHAADAGSKSHNSNGQTQAEDAPWTFAGAPTGSPFINSNHHGVGYPTRERAASFATTAVPGNIGNIVYHANGTVISSPNVYVIWYGNWAGTPCTDKSSTSNTTPGIINYMINNLGASNWYSINKTYFQVLNNSVTYVKPTIPIAGCLATSSLGTTLNTPFAWDTKSHYINEVVTYGLNNGLPTDSNGIYLVLTSADIIVNGFVNSGSAQFCGYHDNMTAPNGTTNVLLATIGDPGAAIGSCSGQQGVSPNNNVNGDAMASVIAHELVETVSDPLGNSWTDSTGWENGDKCAWTWGTTSASTSPGGGLTNIKIAGREYLIQQNLEANTDQLSCALTATALPAAPTITSFTPVNSTPGSIVTITGTNLSKASAVGFGGVLTPTFTVVSDTSISVAIPTNGLSGSVTVTTISGTATSTSAITIPAGLPTITSFTPTFGSPVTITGTNLLGATGVSFNGVAGTITGTPTATSLTATPPALGTSGKITVTTPGGTSAASTAIYYFPAAGITAPASAAVGATITITGTNLLGATKVNFVGATTTVSATPATTATLTSLTVKVPTGAPSGTITVTTPAGVSPSVSFAVVLPAPTVSSFTPTFGSPVTITGTNLLGATGVSFNGVAGTITGTPTATSLTATPPALGTSGKITVTTPGGTSAASTAIYYFPAAGITAPASAAVGATITITGTNLLGATKVNFVGATTTVSATPATTATLTSLTVKVPTGAPSGTITVTTPAGVSPSVSFAIAPTIASFTPTSGTRSAKTVNTVTITGTNLLGATSVTLTGVSGVTIKSGGTATSLVVTFTLPTTLSTSTTAKFTVVTPAGSVTSTGSFSIK